MLDRDQVIKVVADIVGPKHKVDINNHDVLILVDIYKVGYILQAAQLVANLINYIDRICVG